MGQEDIGVWTFAGVFPQDEVHEAAQFWRPFPHLEISSHDLLQILVPVDLEGRFSRVQFMGESAQSPNINFVVVLASSQHFRGQIERSAADSLSEFPGFEDGPPKIANFGHSLNFERST